MAPVYVPESVVSIAAHPDDIEFSCVGTLARWAKLGSRVVYVLCTSGDAGIEEPGMTRARETAKGKEMAYAEAFKVVTLINDKDWEKAKP